MQGFHWQQGVAHLGKGVVKEDTRLAGVLLEQDRPQHTVRGDALVDRLTSISCPSQLRHLEQAGLAGRALVVWPDKRAHA